jgi:uncharacterized protein YciW
MNDEAEQLREAFVTHEYLAPDPDVVYKGIKVRARAYYRRRRTAQAAGGAVLSAGVVAGSVNLPDLLSHSGHGGGTTISLAAPSASAASSTLSQQEQDRALAAYFNAGYGYDDAVQLAKLWNMAGDPGLVKVAAGERLLAGQTLPIAPHPNSAAPPDAPVGPPTVEAFFAAGYTYDDAVTLASLWKTADPYSAKVKAGQRLLAGQTVPVAASTTPGPNALDTARVDEFFAAGYTYGDAVTLAGLWHSADPYSAKIEGGRRIAAAEQLPIPPSSTAATATPSMSPTAPGAPGAAASDSSQADIDAFYAAGYTYNDAVNLAQLWHTTDTYQAKIDGGQKLLAGQTLPIAPSAPTGSPTS